MNSIPSSKPPVAVVQTETTGPNQAPKRQIDSTFGWECMPAKDGEGRVRGSRLAVPRFDPLKEAALSSSDES